jgi:hypothetical protein
VDGAEMQRWRQFPHRAQVGLSLAHCAATCVVAVMFANFVVGPEG